MHVLLILKKRLTQSGIKIKGLYLKLLENEIGGRFYELIKNMYSKTKCAIKLSEYRTSFFQYIRKAYVKVVY